MDSNQAVVLHLLPGTRLARWLRRGGVRARHTRIAGAMVLAVTIPHGEMRIGQSGWVQLRLPSMREFREGFPPHTVLSVERGSQRILRDSALLCRECRRTGTAVRTQRSTRGEQVAVLWCGPCGRSWRRYDAPQVA